MSMTELLNRAQEVKPIATKNGQQIVSYEDSALKQQEAIANDRIGMSVDFGDRELNPDGSIAKSKAPFLAVNEERRLSNRYRVVNKKGGGGKTLQVVNDYRAVKEHPTGQVYLKNIPAYELEREGEDLKLVRTTTVTREEFLTKFNQTLGVSAMYEVNAAIAGSAEELTQDDMPI